MNPNAILYPIFAMFLLTAAVLTRLGSLRVSAVRKGKIRVSWFRFYRGEGGESDQMFFASRNLANLFETPVLFYTGSILIYVTGTADPVFVVLAWLYVLARCIHSYIHITSNFVPRRFTVFVVSGLILLVMWVKLAYQIIVLGGGAA